MILTRIVVPGLLIGIIYPDFPLDLNGFFSGKHLIHFLVIKVRD